MTGESPNAKVRRRAATEQAATWLVALRGGRLSASERGEFVDWLRESPMHISEMLRISQLDRELEVFSGWSEIPTAEQTANNVVWLIGEGPRLPPKRPLFLMLSRAITAGLVVVVLMVGGWMALREKGTIVRTQLAERREMTLADGSIVNVAPLTELRIQFTNDRRSIELRRGHVLFDVSPDRRRPFVVDAGIAIVRAVGTSFDVERIEGKVRIAVIEGHVVVDRSDIVSDGPPPQSSATPGEVLLAANEEVIVPSRGPIAQVREVNGAAQAAWAAGALIFEDETVSEVVRRFNLHNAAQIQILDPQLANRHITGTFRVSDPESFVAFVRATSTNPTHDGPAILLKPRAQ